MNRAKLNYWVDVTIGVAFLLSAVSGLVFLLPVSIESGSGSGVMGISFRVWDGLHTWSSLSMMAGVLAHLVLHWKWLLNMTKRLLSPKACQQGVERRSAGATVTRRQFLSFGLATAVGGAIAAGCAAIARTGSDGPVQAPDGDGALPEETEALARQETDVAEARVVESAPVESGPEPPPDEAQPLPQPEADVAETPAMEMEQVDSDEAPPTEGVQEPAQQELGVACPFGLVDDPFPGRCRRYTDGDGNGICDYSILGSGGNRPTI